MPQVIQINVCQIQIAEIVNFALKTGPQMWYVQVAVLHTSNGTFNVDPRIKF